MKAEHKNGGVGVRCLLRSPRHRWRLRSGALRFPAAAEAPLKSPDYPLHTPSRAGVGIEPNVELAKQPGWRQKTE